MPLVTVNYFKSYHLNHASDVSQTHFQVWFVPENQNLINTFIRQYPMLYLNII